MLTARQTGYLRSLVTATIQKADATAPRVFPDPREKPAARPTVTQAKPRTEVPRFIVQTFRSGRSECEPFGDVTFAMRHASLNAPATVWSADRVTIKDGTVHHPVSEKPLARYA
ncbi:hypothetical protein [Bradyrhizobium elkanii]|uniref:hypothetical protein n=1 Tax=Bradyrhizobium elkanii TaxID=29448 RepID=UPI002714D26A|nr:hypothetical protein [Bradyrhizobium elkanii]WLB77025.1 hypothetical protein QIH83_21655 [Bradyrhizobium elkanii]